MCTIGADDPDWTKHPVWIQVRFQPSRPGLTDYGVDGDTYDGDEPAPNYVGDRQNGDVFDSVIPAPDSSPKLME